MSSSSQQDSKSISKRGSSSASPQTENRHGANWGGVAALIRVGPFRLLHCTKLIGIYFIESAERSQRTVCLLPADAASAPGRFYTLLSKGHGESSICLFFSSTVVGSQSKELWPQSTDFPSPALLEMMRVEFSAHFFVNACPNAVT